MRFAHGICLHIYFSRYAHKGPFVSNRSNLTVACRRIPSAFALGLLTWTILSVIGSSDRSDILRQRISPSRQATILCSLRIASGPDCGDDESTPRVAEFAIDDFDLAQTSVSSHLPSDSLIVLRCAMRRPVRQSYCCAQVEAPDHMIELPGTPPPSFA